jgi:hypothetical protein
VSAEIHINNGGPYCGECGAAVCPHMVSRVQGLHLDDEDIADLKSMIHSKAIDVYKGGYTLASHSRPAARILSRHGIKWSVDDRTGIVSFEP